MFDPFIFRNQWKTLLNTCFGQNHIFRKCTVVGSFFIMLDQFGHHFLNFFGIDLLHRSGIILGSKTASRSGGWLSCAWLVATRARRGAENAPRTHLLSTSGVVFGRFGVDFRKLNLGRRSVRKRPPPLLVGEHGVLDGQPRFLQCLPSPRFSSPRNPGFQILARILAKLGGVWTPPYPLGAPARPILNHEHFVF